jgi:dipeptidyl aminopeptidase/acylaminoacyl peptidase
MRQLVVLIALVLFTAACGGGAAVSPTPTATNRAFPAPYVAQRDGVFSLDLSTGDITKLPVPVMYGPSVLTPDGSRIVYGLPEDLLAVTLDGQQHTVSRSAAGAEPTDLSNDGERILVVGSEGLTELDLTTGGVKKLLAGNINDAAWSPDERKIAFVRDQRLGVLDLDTGTDKIIAPAQAANYLSYAYGAGNLEWSPDGGTIAFGDWKVEDPVTQGSTQLYLIGADGQGLTRLTDSPRAKRYLSFSPDGRYLAYLNSLDNGDRVRVIDLSSKTTLPVEADQGIPFAPAWIDDADFVTSYRDIVATNVDGTRRVLVAAQDDCFATLFGLAQSRVVFMTECFEGDPINEN